MTRSDRLEPQAIGNYLRLQRQLRQIEVEELAHLLRVPVRSIERLEAGYFDGQTDGFVRGFVRTVAEGLGLDPDDTLSRMSAEPEHEDIPRFGSKGRLAWAALGLASLAVLVVLVLVIYRVSSREDVTRVETNREIVLRRDPVRALAASAADRDQAAVQGVRAGDSAGGSKPSD